MGKKKNWRTQRSDNLKVRQGVNGRAVSKDDIKSGALLLNKGTEEHDEDDIWLEDYMYQNSLGVQSNILQWKKGSDKSFRKLYHGDGRTTLYRKRKMRRDLLVSTFLPGLESPGDIWTLIVPGVAL